jgi:hypothetical protein
MSEHQVRKPQVALTVEVSKQASAAETKKTLIEVINRLSEADLGKLRTGIVTVIA